MPKLLELLQQIESLDCDRDLKLSYARHLVSRYMEEHPEENVADIVVASFFREAREIPLECDERLNSREQAILELASCLRENLVR